VRPSASLVRTSLLPQSPRRDCRPRALASRRARASDPFVLLRLCPGARRRERPVRGGLSRLGRIRCPRGGGYGPTVAMSYVGNVMPARHHHRHGYGRASSRAALAEARRRAPCARAPLFKRMRSRAVVDARGPLTPDAAVRAMPARLLRLLLLCLPFRSSWLTVEGDWTVTSAPPECCIAGADGQPWPYASVWLLAFQRSSIRSPIGLNRDGCR
jgi:hypothetical protein